MIKLSVNKTKWSSLLARTRALILYISIWIFDFGPEKLPGLSRNGPLDLWDWLLNCCLIIKRNPLYFRCLFSISLATGTKTQSYNTDSFHQSKRGLFRFAHGAGTDTFPWEWNSTDALKVEMVLLCMDHFVAGRVLDAFKTHFDVRSWRSWYTFESFLVGF